MDEDTPDYRHSNSRRSLPVDDACTGCRSTYKPSCVAVVHCREFGTLVDLIAVRRILHVAVDRTIHQFSFPIGQQQPAIHGVVVARFPTCSCSISDTGGCWHWRQHQFLCIANIDTLNGGELPNGRSPSERWTVVPSCVKADRSRRQVPSYLCRSLPYDRDRRAGSRPSPLTP